MARWEDSLLSDKLRGDVFVPIIRGWITHRLCVFEISKKIANDHGGDTKRTPLMPST
jgi:hypothetical protein